MISAVETTRESLLREVNERLEGLSSVRDIRRRFSELSDEERQLREYVNAMGALDKTDGYEHDENLRKMLDDMGYARFRLGWIKYEQGQIGDKFPCRSKLASITNRFNQIFGEKGCEGSYSCQK